MTGLFYRVLWVLAQFGQDELVKQIEYLKVENEILRSRLPKNIRTTPAERARLLAYGKRLGDAIKELITIVTPRTFMRWVQEEGNKPNKRNRKGGRQPIPDAIRKLVIRIARETGVGYSKILGELKKLGIRVSRTSIHNILKEEGLHPDSRGADMWDNFIKRHARTLWATDFATKKVWTLGGLMDYYILFFIHIETRRVIICPVTAHPDTEWMKQQARNFFIELADLGLSITHLLHDWDTKYMRAFDAIFESEGATVHKVGPLAPNLNAYAERWVQSLKHECLNHFIVFGEKHLQHLVNEYTTYYNELRPHQGVGNVVLDPDAPLPLAYNGEQIASQDILGGLIKHYYRKAA